MIYAAGPVAKVWADAMLVGSASFVSAHLLIGALPRNIGEDKLLAVNVAGSDALLKCSVVWRRTSKDYYGPVLLRLESLTPAHVPADQMQLGRLIGGGMRQCQVTGFMNPRLRRGDHLPTRLLGTVDPANHPGADLLIFEPSRQVASGAGFGGAGLYCDGYLLGVVVDHYDDGVFRAAPMSELLQDQTLRDAFEKELGKVLPVADLSPPTDSAADVIKGVSEADPTNIQEVAAAQLKLSNLYYENVLAQAKRSFNAAVIAAIAGLILILFSILFSLTTQQATAPLVSGIGGAVVEAVAGLNFWLYGRTSLQLNTFHLRLERMQRFLVANSVAASLSESRREEALAELVRVISAFDPQTEVAP